ncbi:MAG TPA: VCBS repeat-containing protein [Mycobacteriales bacterium]|nr:VCBS repeat-containing protein [Mycobacteriales bacterium]
MPRTVAVALTCSVLTVAAISPAAAHDVSKTPASKTEASRTAKAQSVVDDAAKALPLEEHAEYEGQETCSTVERAGVRAFRELVLERFPGTGDSGILRGCHVGRKSEHKEGRAWDWHVDANDPADRKAAEELIAWLLETDAQGNVNARARRLGVMYIIWDRHIWHSWKNPEAGMSMPYDGASPHTDHVHFSFSHDGADGRTSFWSMTDTQIEPIELLGTETAVAIRNVDGVLEWYGADETGDTATVTKFGRGGDRPLAGDWDGDGTAAPGVVRTTKAGRLEWQLMPTAKAKAKQDDGKDAGGKAGQSSTSGVRATAKGTDSKERGESEAAADKATTPTSSAKQSAAQKPAKPRTKAQRAADRAAAKTAVATKAAAEKAAAVRAAATRATALRAVGKPFRYGLKDDQPFVGDWNGDGIATVGVARTVGKDIVWYLSNDNRTTAAKFRYGRADLGDTAVVGDWDGDGITSVGVARRDAAGKLTWWLAEGLAPAQFDAAHLAAVAKRVLLRTFAVPTVDSPATGAKVVFGGKGERPVPGDWDGDGVTSPGTVETQRSYHHWHITNDGGKTYVAFDHGHPGDRTAVGDLDGGTLTDWAKAKPVDDH